MFEGEKVVTFFELILICGGKCHKRKGVEFSYLGGSRSELVVPQIVIHRERNGARFGSALKTLTW